MATAVIWKNTPDNSRAARFVNDWLAGYDLTKLKRLHIAVGTGPVGYVTGLCTRPNKRKGEKTWRLRCNVHVTEYPHEIAIRKRPLYPNADGTWPAVPSDCQVWGATVQYKGGVRVKEWLKIMGRTVAYNEDEAIVWIVGHEVYHFLRDTKQTPGRNTEIEADAFADLLLAQFREVML